MDCSHTLPRGVHFSPSNSSGAQYSAPPTIASSNTNNNKQTIITKNITVANNHDLAGTNKVKEIEEDNINKVLMLLHVCARPGTTHPAQTAEEARALSGYETEDERAVYARARLLTELDKKM
jgi:hypothetical protein